jgi:photosystem II stability/assembly factor-like uncharacterized protein
MSTQAQPGKFDRQESNVNSTDVNWGLYRHINKNNPWPGSRRNPYEITGDYSYQLDGTGTDIVVVDTGIDAYHPEFLEDVNSSIGIESGNAVSETTLNTRHSLRGVIRYNNNVISVGDAGTIFYNTQLVQSSQNYSVMDVTVFNNQLYAVGGYYGASVNSQQTPQGPGIRVLNSATGQTWTDVTPYGTNNAYAQGQLRSAATSATSLVAVGSPNYDYRRFNNVQENYVAPVARILRYNNNVWTNINTSFTPPLNYNLNRVRYFRDRFIAVGDNGTIIISGDDGATWTKVVSGVSCGLHDVTQGSADTGSIYVAVGRGGCILTSTNNINWTVRNSSTVADLFAVSYTGGRFLAMGQNGEGIYSADGITWSTYNTGMTNTIYAATGSDLVTGASTRVQAFDWSSLGVSGISSSVSIGGYLGDSNNYTDPIQGGGHGSNVASIAAGKTNGWAKKAKIYSIRVLNNNGVDITTGSTLRNIDITKYPQLIRAFHNSKDIPRPTITNLSIGYSATQRKGDLFVVAIDYRGNITYNGTLLPFTNASQGLVNNKIPLRVPTEDDELVDAMEDGVIVVGAAGNDYYKQDIEGGADYNNEVLISYYSLYPFFYDTEYYMRGMSPGAAGNVTTGNAVICVGAIDSNFINPTRQVREQKKDFSHTGPRVDIYAAGTDIMGAYRNIRYGDNLAVLDIRSIGTAYSYYFNKLSGTSMACPQITGICSLLAQANVNLTQQGARQQLINSAQPGRLTVTNSQFQNNSTLPNYSNPTSLQGGSNLVAYLPAVPIGDGAIDFFNNTAGSGNFDLE